MTGFFEPLFTESFTFTGYLVCTLMATALGFLVALTAGYKARYSKSFLLTVTLLPAAVETVIMLVNGNIGTGVAVMGAFGLVRFRSAPGSAKEIASLFVAMAIGLATAMGYLGVAVVFTALVCAVMLAASRLRFRGDGDGLRELRLTIPESLNYVHAFDDLFVRYTKSATLICVKTTNMGSLYKLLYRLELKDETQNQAFIDELRCRNGNLEVALGWAAENREEL